ncbi:MAG: DUF177 domain-containing protein [Bacteroidaceae bacterium]|nr:DUF177 domain-containing protein [Bacteroidaceae bacterium]
MGRLGAYKVELKEMQGSEATYEWVVDNDFFALVEGEEVQKGKVSVNLTVTKGGGLYNLDFSLSGNIIVLCDRCLDEMTLGIETTGNLKVRLGADFADDGDIIVVPEEDGTINVAWYIYEFVALAIPLRHTHAPGKCNKDMMGKLNEHSGKDPDGMDSDVQGGTDPRWDGLKGLMDSEEF